MHATGWSRGLDVTGGGTGVVLAMTALIFTQATAFIAMATEGILV